MLNKELEELTMVLNSVGATKETEVSYLDTVTDTFYQIKDFTVHNDVKNLLVVGQGVVEDAEEKQINDTLVFFNIQLQDIKDIDIDICGISITYTDNTVISLEVENTDTMANILDNIEGVDWKEYTDEEIDKVYVDYYREENTNSPYLS